MNKHGEILRVRWQNSGGRDIHAPDARRFNKPSVKQALLSSKKNLIYFVEYIISRLTQISTGNEKEVLMLLVLVHMSVAQPCTFLVAQVYSH